LYAHFARPDAWECVPETADILAELKRRGYRLALASNFDWRLRPVVQGLPALAVLQDIIISSEIGWRKPAPRFFQALARQLQTAAQTILHVGDSRDNDYDGAVQAGLHA
jgi:putative hydrolase of the HAD superfamily